MLNLVFHAKDDLQRELLGELYKPDIIGTWLTLSLSAELTAFGATDEILKESDSVVQRRKEVGKMVQALIKSEAIVASVA